MFKVDPSDKRAAPTISRVATQGVSPEGAQFVVPFWKALLPD